MTEDWAVNAFRYDDGGRATAGYRGTAGDCVCRAVAIAGQRPYAEVYERLATGMATQRRSKNCRTPRRSARNGITVRRAWFTDYMVELGFQWTPTMHIGQGCLVHLTPAELPMGRLVVSLSRHYAAVIDRVLHDISDCSRDGTRCVYGYWEFVGAEYLNSTP